MTGEEILSEVRFQVGDANYPRYNEINRAFRKICRKTSFNWLRKTVNSLIVFTAGVTEYQLDMTNMQQLQRIWVYGVASNRQYWHLVQEAPHELFEQHLREKRRVDGTDDTGRPAHFKLDGGPIATVTVTPVPDQTYDGRVDYIQHIPEISREEVCNVPVAYHDILVQLASGYILEMSSDQAKIILGKELISRGLNEMDELVRDSHPNRTANLDRVEQPWLM